jgi:hypothetical protein
LEGLAEWAQKHFPERLKITPKAIRSAKDAEYADIPLIYRSLVLMATDYWNSRFELDQSAREAARAAYQEKANDLRVEIDRTFSQKWPTSNSEKYLVDWKKRKKLLDMHLKKVSAVIPRRPSEYISALTKRISILSSVVCPGTCQIL